MQGGSRPTKLTTTVWRDDTFFQQFPLNIHSVLQYFSGSPFYDVECNNEECRRRGWPLEMLPTMRPGAEYVVAFASEPVLYVIKKQFRENAKSAKPQAFYYVLFGNVYQAPSLQQCLHARTSRCLHHLQAAFDQLRTDLEPLAWRADERSRQLKRAKVQQAGEGAEQAGAQTDAMYIERESAKHMVQHEPLTKQKVDWIRQTDDVIVNVLSRHVVPLYEAAVPAEAAAQADNASGRAPEPTQPAPDGQGAAPMNAS